MSGRAGRVTDVAVLIGSGGGTADGRLRVRLCSESTSVCADGSRLLAEAADNAYLSISLDQPLTVPPNDHLRYEFVLNGGRNPMAFWTQDAATEPASLRVDGKPEKAHLRFRLSFQ
jgi:hypothetical protein